ncbi:MAG TPA: histidinol dehydrogenase [Acidimicrobiaceae bacterium]|nr:histidinol dehydrogenase [Acidimicrobiaceae bacterium]
MLRRIDLRGFTGELSEVLPRPETPTGGPVDVVRDILAAVAKRGDAAVREYTSRFDGVELDSLVVADAELAAAMERIEPDLQAALELAADRIAAYHQAQMPADVMVEQPGVSIRGMHRAVERAACYVPGGRAVYPSTVLMTAVPARVAGVEQIVVCVPPGPDGKVPDIVLAAAKIAGAHEVVSVGGAQAIRAVAHGTESIRPVDVIVGPGNIYVALAKQEVAGTVSVPSSFAGPSEVVVVADGTDPADFAAVDVILQAEHGPDGLAWFVTWNDAFADEVTASIERLVADAPRRAEIESTLSASGMVVVTDSPEQAMAVSNFIAPEHLEIQTADNEALVAMVRNAGAVFCGRYAPASLGDYVAGPSHVLPTNGTARFASALTVHDFMKDVHIVFVEQEGLEAMGDAVEALAGAEGLDAHAASIRLRRGAER